MAGTKGSRSEQQSAVYRAQAGLSWGRVNSVEEAQAWVDDKTSRDWWVGSYPNVVRIEVEAIVSDGTFTAVGKEDHANGRGLIGIDKNGTDLLTLIHEVAHGVTPAHIGHGQEWARHFLTLTYNTLGSDRYVELYDAFVANGVDIG